MHVLHSLAASQVWARDHRDRVSAAVVVHVLSNWRACRGYFTRGCAAGIVSVAWGIDAVLVAALAVLEFEEAHQVVVEQFS